jgi:hypothetical protein
MQNHSFAKRAGIKYLQPESQQKGKCRTPPAVYQGVPVSSETGIRNIQIRNSVGGGEVACRKRLRQPCAKHHRPDRHSDFSRNPRRNIQSSSTIVIPVITYFILP